MCKSSSNTPRRRSPSFINFFEKRIRYLKESNRFGTATNYLRAKTTLLRFLDNGGLNFSEIDVRFIDRYEDWLMKQGLIRNSVSFHLRIMRAVYNKGVTQGLSKQRDPFREAYTGIDKTCKRSVGGEIVKNIVELNLETDPKLSLARDMFLFSIFARGMAFVDMAFLKKRDILYQDIIYKRKKSNSILKIRIEQDLRTIIDRYITQKPWSPYLFPILNTEDSIKSHQNYLKELGLYNYRLKKLAKMIGGSVTLTSYTARHTWASLMHKMDIPVSVISAGLGHSSEHTTRIYLDSLDNSRVDSANSQLLKSLS